MSNFFVDDSLLLNSIFPEDLKQLSGSELDDLAMEIRQRLLEIGRVCGGHLASNLGVVELTIALHTVFSTPEDKFIWDTSHQTYVHKMLTGRMDQMLTIRQDGGLSGFANIFESEHDAFGAGHASTALSAALGFAHARDILGESYKVVSILGDASLSGGMSFEALNNVSALNSNFICILNDNNMSISRPVGSMAEYMTRVRTSTSYNSAKFHFERVINKIPKIGVPLMRRIEKTVDRFRDIILDVKFGVLFEEFGFKYLGPIDGHNIPMLVAALRYAKNYPGPIMIHINTTKGKGHLPAEEDPIVFHGVAPKPLTVSSTPKPKTYTQVFGQELISLGAKHPDLVVVTPAMKEGSGLNAFAEKFPTRFFDVGIAEEHAVTFCAGLARAGLKPLLSIYSTFLQRGFDQVIHDVCLQKLPVIFAIDRAGLVGEDGPTHHGVFDIAFLLPIPNLLILAPKDDQELVSMFRWATTQSLAISIRYPRGAIHESPLPHFNTQFSLAAEVLYPASSSPGAPFQVLFLTFGAVCWPTYAAAEKLFLMGISSRVVNLRSIKPLDMDTILPLIRQAAYVIVVEDGVGIGGVFSHVLFEVSQLSIPQHVKWHSISIPDRFIEHGKMQTLQDECGLTTDKIVESVSTWVTQFVLKPE